MRFTPSPHGHDLLVCLDRLHKTELVLGARPREHVDVADPFLQRGRVHFRDFSTGDGCLSVADIEHLCDGRCGNLVIARDHRHADAAGMAFLHRLDRFFARRNPRGR